MLDGLVFAFRIENAVGSSFVFGIAPPNALRAAVVARFYHVQRRMASDHYVSQVRLRFLASGCLSELRGHLAVDSAA